MIILFLALFLATPTPSDPSPSPCYLKCMHRYCREACTEDDDRCKACLEIYDRHCLLECGE